MLGSNVNWVVQQSDQFASIVFFKVMRLAAEHVDNKNMRLRSIELNLCIQIWQAKSVECKSIGREFVHVFTYVSQCPELAPIL
jgi:hypothetical protein